MLQSVQEESTVGQIGKSVVECIVGQQFFSPFPIGDVAVHDYKLVRLSFCISDWARGGFQRAPRTVAMAYSVLQPYSEAGLTGFFCRLQHSRAIIGVNLLERRSVLQILGRIPQNFLIGRTVVQSATVVIDERDHIGCIFADELEKLISLRQPTSNTVELPVLVDGVEVEEQYESCQATNPLSEVEPILGVLPTKPRKSEGDDAEGQGQRYGDGESPQRPFAPLDLAHLGRNRLRAILRHFLKCLLTHAAETCSRCFTDITLRKNVHGVTKVRLFGLRHGACLNRAGGTAIRTRGIR